MTTLVAAGVYAYLASLEGIKNVFPILSFGVVPGFSVDDMPDLSGKVGGEVGGWERTSSVASRMH